MVLLCRMVFHPPSALLGCLSSQPHLRGREQSEPEVPTVCAELWDPLCIGTTRRTADKICLCSKRVVVSCDPLWSTWRLDSMVILSILASQWLLSWSKHCADRPKLLQREPALLGVCVRLVERWFLKFRQACHGEAEMWRWAASKTSLF